MIDSPDRAPESFLGGDLWLRQPARGTGYRANVDALLLCRAALALAPVEHALDLGAGTGVVGLAFAVRGGARRITLVERDPHAADLARQNAQPFASVNVIENTVDAVRLHEPVDLVLCNPPYTPPSRGRTPREPRRALARQGALEPFLRATRHHLGSLPSRALFLYPAADLADFFLSAATTTLYPVALRFVHPRVDAAARLAIVTLAATPEAMTLQPPWWEWNGREREANLAAFLGAASRLAPDTDQKKH